MAREMNDEINKWINEWIYFASSKIRELFCINYLQSRFWVKPFDYDDNMQQLFEGEGCFLVLNSPVLEALQIHIMHARVYYLPHKAVFLWFHCASFTHCRKYLFPWPPPGYTLSGIRLSRALDRNYCELSAGKPVSTTGTFQGTWALLTFYTWFREKLYSDDV